MRAYIDPTTGKLRATPAPGSQALELSSETVSGMSSSSDGLVITPSPIAGGGEGIHLQGRFQSPLAATAKDGKFRTFHIAPPEKR